MPSAIFNKNMGDYLDKRSKPVCHQDKLSDRIKCRFQYIGFKIRTFLQKSKTFFAPFDISNSLFDTSKVTIVDAAISPAQKFWMDFKKRFNRKDKKAKAAAQPKDIDISLVQETIKKNKL